MPLLKKFENPSLHRKGEEPPARLLNGAAAAGGIGQLSLQSGQLFRRQVEATGSPALKTGCHPPHRRIREPRPPPCRTASNRRRAESSRHSRMLDFPCGRQGDGGGVGVSPDKPAAPQEDARRSSGWPPQQRPPRQPSSWCPSPEGPRCPGAPRHRRSGRCSPPAECRRTHCGRRPNSGTFFPAMKRRASSSVFTGRQAPMNRDFFSMNSSEASRSTVMYSTALLPLSLKIQDRRRETAPPIPGHKAHYCVQIQKTPTDYLSCRP